MAKPLIFIKLGGSLITDKSRPFTARTDTIDRLSSEIARAAKCRLIVAHGGGSYPHVPAKQYQVHMGITEEKNKIGLPLTQDAAARLNRIVAGSLLKHGVPAFSIQPSACTVMEKGKVTKMYLDSVSELLKQGFTPVLYGDACVDSKQVSAIASTEMLLNYMAGHFRVSTVINCAIVDGVFTADPMKDPGAELIPEITTKNFGEIRKHLAGSHGIDVTGGMLHKVEELLDLAKKGTVCEIINGDVPGRLLDALDGKQVKGTVIRK